MFLNIIIKSSRNKRKVDVFNSISKIEKFKSKSSVIFLFKIKKNNKRNDNFEKKKNEFIKFENKLQWDFVDEKRKKQNIEFETNNVLKIIIISL